MAIKATEKQKTKISDWHINFLRTGLFVDVIHGNNAATLGYLKTQFLITTSIFFLVIQINKHRTGLKT